MQQEEDMICYKDRWWCGVSEGCSKASRCNRVLTKDEAQRADAMGLLVQYHYGRPDCYKERKTKKP